MPLGFGPIGEAPISALPPARTSQGLANQLADFRARLAQPGAWPPGLLDEYRTVLDRIQAHLRSGGAPTKVTVALAIYNKRVAEGADPDSPVTIRIAAQKGGCHKRTLQRAIKRQRNSNS